MKRILKRIWIGVFIFLSGMAMMLIGPFWSSGVYDHIEFINSYLAKLEYEESC